MKTIVAETVMLGREAFETLGEVEVIPDRTIGPEHLADADALIIRSKTKVTPELIEDSPVRFIGTATAGFEHIDFQWLEKSGIGWVASPGCNAESVADYITAALLHLHTFKGVELEGKTLGIIGVGQLGSRVAKRAEALGLQILLNDPPRAAREGNDLFVSLETVLAQSDIITMHLPLITEKPWPTREMANNCFFEKMKHGSLFINASRGEVVDADALLRAKKNGVIANTVLDVWNPEPCIRTDLLEIAELGTAHIAGHSLEGKLNGTIQTYREACHCFGTEPAWNPAPLLPTLDLAELTLNPGGKRDNEVLAEAVRAAYDIVADDAALRTAAVPNETKRAGNFDFLRANYPVRREFSNTRVILSQERPELLRKLQQIGFISHEE